MTKYDDMPLQLRREAERWYPLIEHPVQTRLITDHVRFKVVPAGRRSGKTERAKRFIAKQAMQVIGQYFAAAPTRDQAKKIFWNDLKLLTFSSTHAKEPSESELTIFLDNGSTIVIVGLDKPERIEGAYWKGGIIDEIANIKSNAWDENIAPALDTYNPNDPNYRPWCWLIGVPEGLNHYYKLAEYARNSNDLDWELYTWRSSDILPKDVIESAKRRMSKRQFQQEYEASFETVGGRIYDDYCKNNHTIARIESHEQLHWFHDFNFTPLSSGIGVIRNESDFYVLDEIILTSAVARQSAEEFCDKFKNHKNKNVIVYGDPSGKVGEKHGHSSDYIEIETVLKNNNWKFERKVRKKAPAIRDRQNSVRAKICNAANEISLFVNVNKAPTMHEGLATLQAKEGSTFIEEVTNSQHITTAIGYCIDFIWPIRRPKEDKEEFTPKGSLNYYNGK